MSPIALSLTRDELATVTHALHHVARHWDEHARTCRVTGPARIARWFERRAHEARALVEKCDASGQAPQDGRT